APALAPESLAADPLAARRGRLRPRAGDEDRTRAERDHRRRLPGLPRTRWRPSLLGAPGRAGIPPRAQSRSRVRGLGAGGVTGAARGAGRAQLGVVGLARAVGRDEQAAVRALEPGGGGADEQLGFELLAAVRTDGGTARLGGSIGH